MTPKEFDAARTKAAMRSEEALIAFDRQTKEIIDQGIANGGLKCCGSKGFWHHPWCYSGPKEPDKKELHLSVLVIEKDANGLELRRYVLEPGEKTSDKNPYKPPTWTWK